MKHVNMVFIGCGVSGKATTLSQLLKLVNHAPELQYREAVTFEWMCDQEQATVTARILSAIWGPYVLTEERLSANCEVQEELTALQEAHGAICVIDSQIARLAKNVQAIHMLKRTLEAIGRSVYSFPIVFQLNKRDVPHILSIQHIQQRIEWPRCRFVPTVAVRGEGIQQVLESFFELQET